MIAVLRRMLAFDHSAQCPLVIAPYGLVVAGFVQLVRCKQWPVLATIFALNGLLHMLLDFIASNIYWLAPWVKKPFPLFDVPSVYDPWWLKFLLYRSLVL